MCFVVWLTAAAVWADEVTNSLPQSLSRVTLLANLKAGDYYAVLKNMNKENYELLGTHYAFKDKGCMAAGKRAEPTDKLEASMTVKTAKELWQLTVNDNGRVMLRNAETGRYLGREAKNSESLTLHEVPSALCEWELRERDNGSFDLAVAGTNRVLEYGYRSGKDVFSLYAQSRQKGLWLYRLPTHYADIEGEAAVPADGCRVALCNAGWVRSADGKALNTEHYRLTDGTLAEMPGVQGLTCERLNETDFALRDEGGRFLNYALQMGSERCIWRVVNGQVRTAEAKARFLCFDAQTKRWFVANEEVAQTTALFATVAPAAAMSVDDEGICRLSGGWDADALAALDCERVNVLDLTEAVLPRKARGFERLPTERNVPVFVREADGEMAKAIWPFVIGCGATNRLLTRYELKDRGGFVTHRSFSADAGMLSYRRKGPNVASWQTVCLPFEVDNPGMQVAELTDFSNGVLSFGLVKRLKAGVAYIVYASADLYWRNAACTVVATAQSGRLQGCFTPWMAAEGAASAYLLLPEQNAFAMAPGGSTLPPFRAFLRADQTKGLKRAQKLLRFKIPK